MSKASKEGAPPGANQRLLLKRFGPTILAEGYTCLPNILIKQQGQIGITSAEMNVITALWQCWWESYPFPKVRTIAAYIGKGQRAIQATIRQLKEPRIGEEGEVIRPALLIVSERFSSQDGAQLSNKYDFTPLLAILETLSRREEPQEEDSVQNTPDESMNTERMNLSSTTGRIKHRTFEEDESEEDIVKEEDSNLRGASAPSSERRSFFGGSNDYTNRQNPGKGNGSYNEANDEQASKENRNRNNRNGLSAAGAAQASTQALKPPVERGERPHMPAYPANVLTDISDQFHDLAPASSQTRAAKLWELALSRRMTEQYFVEKLYWARTMALKGDVDARNRDGSINRMPYFFTTFSNEIRRIVAEWDEQDAEDAQGGNPYDPTL